MNAEPVGDVDLSFLHGIARALSEWTRKCRRFGVESVLRFQRASDVNGDARHREGAREGQCALEERFGEVIDREEGQIDGEPDQRSTQRVTRAHATPFDIDVPKTSVGQYGWTEGGKKPEAWAKFIHIGSDGGFDSTHGAAGGLTADFLDRYIFRAN